MAFLWHLIVYLWRQLYLNQNKFYTMKKTFENAPCLWWLSFKCYRLFQIVRTFWGQITFCLWGLLSSAIVCFTKWGHFEDNYLRFFLGGYSPVLVYFTQKRLWGQFTFCPWGLPSQCQSLFYTVRTLWGHTLPPTNQHH